MNIKIKRLHDKAIVPLYAKHGDACFDLVAVSTKITDKYIEYGTGLSMEIPEGYVGLVFARSSVSDKDIMLKNCVGIIDSCYRGEIKLRYATINRSIKRKATQDELERYIIENNITDVKEQDYIKNSDDAMIHLADSYTNGDRVGQMMIIPVPFIQFEEVDNLSGTSRGDGGFGHTGI